MNRSLEELTNFNQLKKESKVDFKQLKWENADLKIELTVEQE